MFSGLFETRWILFIFFFKDRLTFLKGNVYLSSVNAIKSQQLIKTLQKQKYAQNLHLWPVIPTNIFF